MTAFVGQTDGRVAVFGALFIVPDLAGENERWVPGEERASLRKAPQL